MAQASPANSPPSVRNEIKCKPLSSQPLKPTLTCKGGSLSVSAINPFVHEPSAKKLDFPSQTCYNSTMQPNLTKVDCSRGAPMGRPNRLPADPQKPIKLHLVQMKLVDGDYDRGGAYWGGDSPMWCAFSNTSDLAWQVFVRGATRTDAKANVRKVLPNATFYR
jgi:hypothetical protein